MEPNFKTSYKIQPKNLIHWMNSSFDAFFSQNYIDNPSEITIISHKEDPDGIISAAFLKYWGLKKSPFKVKFNVHLVNYRELPGLITNLMNEKSNFKNILDTPMKKSSSPYFLIDLSLNKNVEKIFNGKLKNFQFFYLDHHNIDLPLKNQHTVDEFNSFFSFYMNPTKFQPKIQSALDSCPKNLIETMKRENNKLCTAEVVLYTLGLDEIEEFTKLAQYAHYVDYDNLTKIDNLEEQPVPEQLKSYIIFHQTNKSKLLELVDNLADPSGVNHFLEVKLPMKIKGISIWYEKQYNLMEMNKKIDHNSKFICISSAADLEPGIITKRFLSQYPKYDLYIGYSKKNGSVSIRTKAPITADLCGFFGGGGRTNKGKFPIPGDLLKESNNNESKNNKLNSEQIPRELYIRIIEKFKKLIFLP